MMDDNLRAEKAINEGNYKLAEKLYLDLIKKSPDNVNLYNNLAVCYIYQQNYAKSFEYLNKIHKKYPQEVTTIINIANTYSFSGNLDEAINYYNKAARILPSDDIYINLALIYKKQNKLDKSIEFYNKAISLNPNNYLAYYNAAIAYRSIGNTDKALELYKKSVQIYPDFIHAHTNIANIYFAKNNFSEAIPYYEKSLELNPSLLANLLSLGKSYNFVGNSSQAEVIFNKALKVNPNAAEAYFLIGNLKAEQAQINEAVSYYKKSVEIEPSLSRAYQNLSFIYEMIGDSNNAIKYFSQYCNLNPDDKLIAFHKDTIQNPIMFDNEEIDNSRAKLLEKISTHNFSRSDFNLNEIQDKNIHPSHELIYQGRNDLEIRKSYASLFEYIFPKMEVKEKITGKPKIAFLVTRGHEGVFLKSMKGIINNLSLDKFDITVVSNNQNVHDMLRGHLKSEIKLMFISRLFSQAVEEMSQAKFDIIHYWEIGTDTFGYFLPFFRLAPIQLSSWGCPVTSGIPEVDYFVSSHFLEPENGQEHYTEKLIKFRYIPTYYYKPEISNLNKSHKDFSLPENTNIYLCAQNLRKVHPDFDNIVDKVLDKDKNGIVVFISNKYEHITTSLKNRLHTKYPHHSERIFFMPFMGYDEYTSLMKISSVSLDTLHYSGANTTYDAFVNNLPVVTLPGEFHRGRHTYACYQEIEVTECIASDVDNYVEIAVNLANNQNFRKAVNTKIKNSYNILFEDINVVKEYSDFFEDSINKYNKY